MQIADESRAHGSRVSPCQVEPMEDAIGRVMRETCDSPQTVTLPQEGQGFDHHQARATHGLEARVLICAKGVTTGRTVIALFNVTEDPDIASVDCAKVGTGFVVTPLPREFHDVSPPPTHDDTSNGLSWLGVPSEGFTAYVYSTLIAACLAYIWIVYLGSVCAREGWTSIIHRMKRCDLSLFQLGMRLLEYFLNEELPIPVQFHVTI